MAKIPKSQAKLNELGLMARKNFDETEKQKQLYRETEFLEGLRQYKGIYDPDIEAKIKTGKSKVYPRYTRQKVNPAIAKLNNMLFPDNDKNWEIEPTPEPELSEEQINEIAASLQPVDENGEPREITELDIEKAIMDFAMNTTRRMARTMDDQLTELKYRKKAKAMIKSGVMYGTGIMKGPLAKSITSRKIKRDGIKFIQIEKQKYMPHVENVSIWHWYPDMSATELEDCAFVCELHPMTKHELRKLAKKKNFKTSIINDYIRKNKNGNYKLRQWELDLRVLKEEENVHKEVKKYEVIEINIYIDGHDLIEAGVIGEKEDPNKDWLVNMWLLGNEVIKITTYPDIIKTMDDLYHVFYFEKDESSIFGEGLPKIIRHTQLTICSATRAMLDNAAWVAGPIFELNSELAPDEDIDDIHPGRGIEREGMGATAQYPALRVFNIESRINEYLALLDKAERMGDSESTLPGFLYGEAAKTTNETSKGISIRNSNTNLTINDIVKNFDEANEKFLAKLYEWNMKYNPDDSIKGDMKVKAIGSSSLVAKEARTEAMNFFSQTLTERDEPYVKRLKLLESRTKLLDLKAEELLNTEEEANAIIERDSQLRQQIAQREQGKLEAETRYEHAKALNMETKSEATLKGISQKELEIAAKVIETMRKGGQGGEERTSPATT